MIFEGGWLVLKRLRDWRGDVIMLRDCIGNFLCRTLLTLTVVFAILLTDPVKD